MNLSSSSGNLADDHNKAKEDLHDSTFDNILEEFAIVDTTELSESHQREIRFEDVFHIARSLGILRMRLHYSLNYHEDSGDNQSISRVSVVETLSELHNIELTLAITNTCPDILTQMKQQRKQIARRYFDELPQDSEADKDEIFEQIESFDLDIGTMHILYDNIVDWLYILSTEMRDKISFSVPQNPRLNLERVMRNPNSFFSEDVWDSLDEFPKQDFKESCRCLAFGSSTASVMLSLRAVEYCLRDWYEYYTGRQIEDRTWGQVVSELEDQFEDADERPSVLSNLDYLKDRRNAVSHPENSPSRREAERMLYRIEGTIAEIHHHKKSSGDNE